MSTTREAATSDDKTTAARAAPAAPENLLTGFSRTNVWQAFVVAMILHVVVIGGTSGRFIYDSWIDPEGAALRKAEEDDKKKEAKLAAEEATRAEQEKDKQKDGKGDAKGIVYSGLVEYRQHSGHTGAYRADSDIGLALRGIDHGTIAKHLGTRFENCMYF